MRSVSRTLRCLALVFCALLPAALASTALAEPTPNDPLAYDLRVGLFPVAFQAGVDQSWFGSAFRADYRVARKLDVFTLGRGAWWNVTGDRHGHEYTLGAGVAIHLSESLDSQKLVGNVFPDNPPAILGAGSYGSPTDLEVPTSTKLGGAPFVTDYDREATAVMLRVVSLRLGFSYVRASVPSREMPIAQVGLDWSTYWNIDPSVTGKRELGFRRFYLDALVTVPALASVEKPKPAAASSGVPASTQDVAVFPLGARLGMEGSLDALIDAAPGVGFGYTLELGALPSDRSVEGYLFVGLGLALDFATRSRN